MRLKIPEFKMRGLKAPGSWELPIVDLDKKRDVGFVRFQISPPIRKVSLFDGRYKGSFESDRECAAFVKGVQVVLKTKDGGLAREEHSRISRQPKNRPKKTF